MKEFGYVISTYNKGEMFNFEVKIEEHKTHEFLSKINFYSDLRFKGHLRVTLLYVQDMETLEKEYLYTDVCNELANERIRKRVLLKLNGETIKSNAVMGYLNYSSAGLTDAIYMQGIEYKFILDSTNINIMRDIDITGFSIDEDILTFYNGGLDIVCKLKMVKKEWYE